MSSDTFLISCCMSLPVYCFAIASMPFDMSVMSYPNGCGGVRLMAAIEILNEPFISLFVGLL